THQALRIDRVKHSRTPVELHPATTCKTRFGREAGGSAQVWPGVGSGRAWVKRWGTSLRRMGANTCTSLLGNRQDTFEEALHGFMDALETADSPPFVESALLKMARRIVPGSRAELVRPQERALHASELGCDEDGGCLDGGPPLRGW